MNNLMFGVSVTLLKVREQVNPSLWISWKIFKIPEDRKCCRDRRLKS